MYMELFIISICKDKKRKRLWDKCKMVWIKIRKNKDKIKVNSKLALEIKKVKTNKK